METQFAKCWNGFYLTIKNTVQVYNDEEGMDQILEIKEALGGTLLGAR
jgi:hypothetical protein